MLWATGAISIKHVQDAKALNRAIKLPLAMNPETGKQSSRQTAFSDLGWGGPTRSYLESINRKLTNNVMKDIMDEAKEFAMTYQKKEAGNSVSTHVDPDDDRAQLADGSGSDLDSE